TLDIGLWTLWTLGFARALPCPAAARFEKEIVHSLGDQFVFAIGEFPLGIEPFEFGGGGFGAVIAIFLECQRLTSQARESVDQARESFGWKRGGVFRRWASQTHQLFHELRRGEAQASFVKARTFRLCQHVRGKLGFGGDAAEPFA